MRRVRPMTAREKLARAMRDEIGRQWNAKPIPGVPEIADSWTAEGGTIDLEKVADAALDALMSPGDGVIAEVIGQVPGFGNPAKVSFLKTWRAGLHAVKEGK